MSEVNVEQYGFTNIGITEGVEYYMLYELNPNDLKGPNVEITREGNETVIMKTYPDDMKVFEKEGKKIYVIPPVVVFKGQIEENWELEFILKRTCLDAWDDSIIEKIYNETA